MSDVFKRYDLKGLKWFLIGAILSIIPYISIVGFIIIIISVIKLGKVNDDFHLARKYFVLSLIFSIAAYVSTFLFFLIGPFALIPICALIICYLVFSYLAMKYMITGCNDIAVENKDNYLSDRLVKAQKHYKISLILSLIPFVNFIGFIYNAIVFIVIAYRFYQTYEKYHIDHGGTYSNQQTTAGAGAGTSQGAAGAGAAATGANTGSTAGAASTIGTAAGVGAGAAAIAGQGQQTQHQVPPVQTQPRPQTPPQTQTPPPVQPATNNVASQQQTTPPVSPVNVQQAQTVATAVKGTDTSVTKLPVVLLLDTSPAVSGSANNSVFSGVKGLVDFAVTNEAVNKQLDMEVIEYNDSPHILKSFDDKQLNAVRFSGGNTSNMGAAVSMAADEMSRKLSAYSAQHIDTYKPWIFMISSGQSADDIRDARQKINAMENQSGLKLFTIGISGADTTVLKSLTTSGKLSFSLPDIAIPAMFSWITESMKSICSANKGDNMKLPPLPADVTAK